MLPGPATVPVMADTRRDHAPQDAAGQPDGGLARTLPAPGSPEQGPAQAPGGERMHEALKVAAVQAEETGGLGRPGRPVNKRSPFFIGMTAAAGVAVTYGLAELTIRARSVLVLIGLALFIAIGLDPVVAWLTRRRVPRWAAVVIILLAGAGIIAGFVMAAIPPLVEQTKLLVAHFPHYAQALQSHDSVLGRLNTRFHIQQRLTHLLSSKGGSLVGGVLGAGEFVLSAASSAVIVVVLVIYFLADLPRIKLFGYRLAPHTRRARVILIGDEILSRVGGFLLGNLLTSVVAGLGTYLWMIAWGIPYPVLLGLLVALLDLIPVIGSTIGGVVVTLVALSVSLPVAIATLVFYIAYRLAEDYLLVPRVMGKTVQVPGVVSVVAVLVGGTLMGIVGALVAIPAAAALRLLLHEIAFRRLDRT